MNLTSVFLQHKKGSPLDWINFDSDSGKMLGCSVPTTHRFRALFESQHWSIRSGKLIMTAADGEQKERDCESIHQFKTGA